MEDSRPRLASEEPAPSVIELFAAAFPVAVMVHSMDFVVLAANTLCEPVLGSRVSEIVGRPVADFVPAGDRSSARAMADELDATYPEPASAETQESVAPGVPIASLRRINRADGEIVSCWMHVGIAVLDGQRVIVACLDLVHPVADDTLRWRQRAEHDELTGLLRRIPFGEYVDHWIDSERQPILFALIDVDGLKAVNDTHGHTAGDHVLRVIAQRLMDCTPSTGVVGRFAGDEFIVAVPGLAAGADANGGYLTIDSLTGTLQSAVSDEPIPWSNELLTVTVSVGVAQHRPGESIETMVARADRHMYDNKNH